MSSNKRQRRDERAPNSQPIRLMARDIQIMHTIYLCRVLTTQQIQRLFFPSLHTAYARLAALYNHEFLDRRFRGVYIDKMNTPIMYVLDKRGAELLQAELGTDVDWHPSHKEVSQQFLDHSLALNEVRIDVMLACATHPALNLLTWLSESDLKADYERVNIQLPTGQYKDVSLIPDSYFILQTPLGNSHCFIELDRGTMSIKRFKEKILAYQQYYKTGRYQARYQTRSLRILTITTSQARADNLQQAATELHGGQRFWFTTLDQIQQNEVLTEPIWQVAPQTAKRVLIDLTSY